LYDVNQACVFTAGCDITGQAVDDYYLDEDAKIIGFTANEDHSGHYTNFTFYVAQK
jgi:hypothetical protein